jgi:prepilin peptidase dependent protein B
MLTMPQKQSGLTLPEILIALTLNVLIFTALISIFIGNLKHHRDSLNATRLTQNLQSVLNVMGDDIVRAGYWANARTDIGTNLNNNPFMASGVDLAITGGNCILFAYDHDSNGSLPSISSASDDERYGFRLVNQAIQARPPGATFACNAANNAWENMTDTNLMQITNLTFTLTSTTIATGPGSRSLLMRVIDISVTGQLTSNTSITRTLTKRIKIRNDKFIP